MRQDNVIEDALLAKTQQARTWKKKNCKENLPASNQSNANNYNKGKDEKKSYPPYQHRGKYIALKGKETIYLH